MCLTEAGISLKSRECSSFTNQNDYVGDIIKPGRPEVSSHAADAIHKLQLPTLVPLPLPLLERYDIFKLFSNFDKITSTVSKRIKATQNPNLVC